MGGIFQAINNLGGSLIGLVALGGCCFQGGLHEVTGFNNLSIGFRNPRVGEILPDRVGDEAIPSYNLRFQDQNLRCGDLHAHLELEERLLFLTSTFAVDVDDLPCRLRTAPRRWRALTRPPFVIRVNELAGCCVQMYLRDPAEICRDRLAPTSSRAIARAFPK